MSIATSIGARPSSTGISAWRWGIGGWLLLPFLKKIGSAAAEKLRRRVAAEVKTAFASHYTETISLAEALRLDAISVYGHHATGGKYLINPNRGMSPST
jgi:NADPH2:quinone reductase